MSEELRDAVRAVLEAARTWRAGDDASTYVPGISPLGDLVGAVDALRAALATATAVERSRPWREVLAGDEVYAPKTGKWYLVDSVDGTTNGTTSLYIVKFPGFIKRHVRNAEERVLVRRHAGPESDAVAVLERAGFDVSTLASGG
jgi:hypothetical protein